MKVRWILLLLVLVPVSAELILRIGATQPLRKVEGTYERGTFERVAQDVKLPRRGGGTVEYRVSEEGFRGRTTPAGERAKGPRVIVVGAASAFGLSLDDADTFPARLEEELRKAPGCAEAEVLNAAVPGAIVADLVGQVYTDLHRFHPDVILAYDNWTDLTFLTGNQTFPEKVAKSQRLSRAATVLRPVIDRSALALHLFQLYAKAMYGYHSFKGNLTDARPLRPEPPQAAAHPNPAALEQFRMSLTMLSAATRAAGARLIYVPELTLLTTGSPPEALERIHVQDDFGFAGRLEALAELRKINRETGAREKFAVIDLHDELSGKGPLFQDQVHFTRDGASAVAAALGKKIVADVCRRTPRQR